MDFRAILTALEDADVRYVLVGGVAAVLHGVPVNTFDIDIVPARDPENAGRLAVVLRGLDACYRQHLPKRIEPLARDLTLPGHHLLMTRCGPLDVRGEIVGGRSYPDLVVHAPRVDLHDGLRVQFTGVVADRAVFFVHQAWDFAARPRVWPPAERAVTAVGQPAMTRLP